MKVTLIEERVSSLLSIAAQPSICCALNQVVMREGAEKSGRPGMDLEMSARPGMMQGPFCANSGMQSGKPAAMMEMTKRYRFIL
jgi:hypothetical protein